MHLNAEGEEEESDGMDYEEDYEDILEEEKIKKEE